MEGGIFGDQVQEDFKVTDYVETGANRLRIPEWRNSKYSAPCEYNCPVFIPTQKRIALLRQGKVKEALELVLEHSPFPASVCGQVCPNLCQDECSRLNVDVPVKIKEMGMLSRDVTLPAAAAANGCKVAVIGAGAAGLTAGFHLKRMGYAVDILEADSVIGGKLMQVIPEDRLARDVLSAEIKRILDTGVNVKTDTRVDKDMFAELCGSYDAVVVAVGAHEPCGYPF
ncbi:MAG: NAD(P)-binding protein [Geovibrio sp.]|nr:NAD(P)-binding protein [Geovibrio sp.]